MRPIAGLTLNESPACLVVLDMQSYRNPVVAMALAALVVWSLAGCASMSGGTASGAAASTSGATTASNALGKIIVDGAGHTAYFFDNDTANSGKSACSGGCSATWPAITSSSKSPTVSGVTGTVGTIADGSRFQITINGLPIYAYSGDNSAGDTNGQGSGGTWWVAGANGKEIKKGQSHGGY
jgi:predicted lipoprotein with Yx(FWY)xxD motif